MLKRYNPRSVWTVPETFERIYSHASEVSAPKRLLTLSGQIGLAPDGITADGFEAQCLQAMQNVENVLEAAEMSLDDVLRITYYLTSADHLAELTAIRTARWGSKEPPAVTTLVVAGLATPDLLVEIKVTAGQS